MLVPRRLVVMIGGFGGPNYKVRWRRDRLDCQFDDIRLKVAPSAHDWASFWSALDRIGVWRWQPHYHDLDVVDGTQWSLDLDDGVQKVQCSGSNAYPGGNDLEQAQPFQEFLAAISALIRHPFGQ